VFMEQSVSVYGYCLQYPHTNSRSKENIRMEKNIRQLVAQNLKRLMSRPGKETNLKELATKAKLNYSTVQRISKAETDVQISNLYALSIALGVTLDEFVAQEAPSAENQELIRKIGIASKTLTAAQNRMLLTVAQGLMQMGHDEISIDNPNQPPDEEFTFHRAIPR
jgi:transcriptional regulator with XRE-family HTH domain